MKDKNSISSEDRLHLMGINSTSGIALISASINRYFDIHLAYYTVISAKQKNEVSDQMAVFTNYTPNLPSSPAGSEVDNLFDLCDLSNFRLESSIEKYMLVQSKGEFINLFPRIRQIDYVLISNYALAQKKSILKEMEGVNYVFDLTEEHLGTKLKYFRELMW